MAVSCVVGLTAGLYVGVAVSLGREGVRVVSVRGSNPPLPWAQGDLRPGGLAGGGGRVVGVVVVGRHHGVVHWRGRLPN